MRFPEKAFKEHKGIIFCKLLVKSLSCVSLLLAGRNTLLGPGTRPARALLTGNREKNVCLVEVIKASERVSL